MRSLGPAPTGGRVHDIIERALRLLPAVIGVGTLALLVVPLLVMIPVAFSDLTYLSFPPGTYSLRWFGEFFSDPGWYGSMIRSAIISVAAASISLILGTACAFGLVRGSRLVARVVQPLVIAPLVVPTIVTGIAMFSVLGRVGLVDTYAGLIVAYLVITLPLVVLTVSPAVGATDRQLEAAAATLGATWPKVFWHVVLPQLRGSLLAAWLFALITAFDEIIIALFLSGQNTKTLPRAMWDEVNQVLSPIVATAGVLLVGITAGVLALAWGVSRKIRT